MLAPIAGPAADRIRNLQRQYDPKLAGMYRPHLTLAGSSGVGPIAAGTPLEVIRAALEPVARATAPLSLRLAPPHRFMQTSIVSFPLDPHGPLRTLHDRIARSGLRFLSARFTFTPHITVSFYPELTRERERALLALRVSESALVDRLVLSATAEPFAPRVLFEIPLGG